MRYFAAFIAAVPTANRDAYAAYAQQAWEVIFKPLGALGVVEAWGDQVPEGETTSLPMAVQCKADETVVMSWVEWPDKATHDAANAAMMAPDFAPEMAEMPFDGTRIIFGAFAPLLVRRR